MDSYARFARSVISTNWCDGASMGQKISAKQLKAGEGGDSSCANALWGTFVVIIFGDFGNHC
ncbi:hypothetical protein [Kluyvera ascorbata]|uniref:hypothetical protein n=1 Tax=Kluyvera ascorbata TaxID=51288 RepID=UPI0039F71AA2